MPIPVGDSLRALAVGRQAVWGTAAATLVWLNFIEDYQHKPNLKKDVPKFKNNRRWMEYKVEAQTRYDEVTVKGRVDSTDIGWLLISSFGPCVDTTHTHTFLGGQPQPYPVTSTNSMLLTVAWYDGNTNLWWEMIDGRTTKISFAIDATGNITFDATIRGIKAAPKTTPPTPTYAPPPDNSPFQPWQVVCTKNGTAAAVVSFKIDINNNFDPYYATPTVAPGSTTEAGLYPIRFTDGEVVGQWDLVYEYTADAASSFYDYRFDVNEAWIIEATDAPSAGALTYTPTFHMELPILGATDGSLDRSKPNVFQNVKGEILYSSSLGSGVEIVLTNGQTAYAAS